MLQIFMMGMIKDLIISLETFLNIVLKKYHSPSFIDWENIFTEQHTRNSWTQKQFILLKIKILFIILVKVIGLQVFLMKLCGFTSSICLVMQKDYN